MHCPNCGARVGETDAFCSTCGAALTDTAGPGAGNTGGRTREPDRDRDRNRERRPSRQRSPEHAERDDRRDVPADRREQEPAAPREPRDEPARAPAGEESDGIGRRELLYGAAFAAVAGGGWLLFDTVLDGGSPGGFQPTDGLGGYWSLDSVEDRTVPDRSGNGHAGTIHGTPSQVAGAVGQALEFDGVGDFVVVDMTPELQTRGSFTVELWLKTTATTNGSPLGLYTYDGGGQGEGVWINAKSDAVSFTARHSSGYGQPGGGAANDPYYHVPGSPPTITPNRWHHVALRYATEVQTIFLYVDGEERFSLPAPKEPRVDDSFLAIGARPKSEGSTGVSVTNYFAGAVDEIAVYSQALSPETIQAHANRG